MKLNNVYSLFSQEFSKDIILNIFPQLKYYKRLKKLNTLNKKLRNNYDSYLILALLILDQTNDYEYFCHKYKTSNITKSKFKNISENFEKIKNKKFYSQENIKREIYLSNKDYVTDLLLFSICENNKIKNFDIEKLINYATSCKIPKFPISGDYLKKYGYVTGETLGKKLKLIESKWIENGFILEKEMIQKFLEKASKD